MSVYKKIQFAAIFLQELETIGELNMSKLDKIDNLPNNPPFKNFIKIRIIHNQISEIDDDIWRFFYSWILNSDSQIILPNTNTKRRIYPKEKYMNILINFLLEDIRDDILQMLDEKNECINYL